MLQGMNRRVATNIFATGNISLLAIGHEIEHKKMDYIKLTEKRTGKVTL